MGVGLEGGYGGGEGGGDDGAGQDDGGRDGGGGDGGEAILPASIHDTDILNEGAADYLYLEGIKFIKFLKTGAPFAETSPILNDISGLSDWKKICAGLLRMYQAEVLNKFPVVQHFLFGTILTPPSGGGIDHRAVPQYGQKPDATA